VFMVVLGGYRGHFLHGGHHRGLVGGWKVRIDMHEILPKRVKMLPEFMDGGEKPRAQRQHYPPQSFRDGITPPAICPRCGTPTHEEYGLVYCRDRNHSWAVPIPTEPFNWTPLKCNHMGPRPYTRTITCAFCRETVTGEYMHNQKFCSRKCYEDARRIQNRMAYRKKRRV